MSTSTGTTVAGTGASSPRLTAVPASAWSLAAALPGFFVVTLDAVIVNVALPDIRRKLAGGMSGLQWVADGYTLMFAALLLSAGSLSDRAGARRAFGAGLVVFVLASAACGLAPSPSALVAARFVQGSAAAAMMPSSMALVSHAYPDPARRARAVALWSMGGVAASTSGPVLGGLLSLVSWRLIFFVNVPAGAVALALLARAAGSPRHSAPFDWAGQATAVAGMGGLTYGAIEAGAAGITAPRVLAAFAVAVAALAVFGLLQARGRHPMMPLSLFRSRTVTVAVATGFAFMVLSALMILAGLAGPLVMPPVMTLLLHAVPARRAGVASGVFNTSRQVGGALAVAVFGALLASRATFLHGLRASLLAAAAVALAAAAVSLLRRPAGDSSSPVN